MNTFDTLPVAACINGKFLCMHGGISPDIRKLDDINNFDRRREIPKDGPMCDLLWSDPFDENKEGVSEEAVAAMKKKKKKYAKDEEDSWFTYNHTRQCSFLFG